MIINHWHRMAQLYLNDELKIDEIVKTYMICGAVQMYSNPGDSFNFTYNVFRQSKMNDLMVFTLLKNRDDPKTPISYSEIGEILHMSSKVVGISVRRLAKSGSIKKEDYGTAGAFYKIVEPSRVKIPTWLSEFTKALLEIHVNDQLAMQAHEEMSKIEFSRGVEALMHDVSRKFTGKSKD